MKTIIPKFDQGRVLVLGDIMLDRYWEGPTNRISPEAPVPVTTIKGMYHRPGGSANVALNIATLGGSVSLVGFVGKDEQAQLLEERLNQSDVDCQFISLKDIQTTTKLRIMSHEQQLIRLDFDTIFPQSKFPLIIDKFETLLRNASIVVLSDYAKGTLHDTQQLIKMSKAAGLPVIVDPKGKDFNKYRHASLIVPNQSEFETIVGKCTTDKDIISKGSVLLEDLQIDSLLVTRGEKGMILIQTNEEPTILPTRAKEVYDVTGAGDTVIGTIAIAIANGESTIDAVRLANLAGGIVVGKLGTSTVNRHELQKAILEHIPLQQGIMDEIELQEVVLQAKTSGEKIVMTNGCFDILHIGHVKYLEQASQLGDRLIVAVNSDDSVSRLKGNSRPINNIESRMAVLSALKSVDWVVSFNDLTPEKIISEIAPDFLVKGGNYKIDEVVGADSVLQNGGEVKVLDFTEGASTTKLLEDIVKKDKDK
jgi:D-beta-D-heptose 7-phosphate kinase / D-beta-D-heptose 1-phosphate adenosyltransferase